ncbi:putative phage abortive infection protein [Paenibacillus sp. FSL R5-0475]|uniref:putative phage abortive infection protein n=1 Tax=Paenibacillus sp. FSL R5-0475 TaxID=2921643 RepID=UPI0030FABF59
MNKLEVENTTSKQEPRVHYSNRFIKVLILLAVLCTVLGMISPFVIKEKFIRDVVINDVYEKSVTEVDNSEAAEVYPYTQLSDLGPIGDWLGGSSTPLFTLASFFILVAALLAQMVELRATRDEFSKQNETFIEQNKLISIQRFESTFFQMTSLYNEIISTFSDKTSENEISGREMLGKVNNSFNEKLLENIRKYLHPKKYGLVTNQDLINIGRETELLYEIFIATYNDFYNGDDYTTGAEETIGHYLRNLYNILRWVHFAKSLKTHDEKMDYIRIIRAQLSSHELKLIYYNCIHPYGYRMKELADQYNLFDNLNLNSLLIPDLKLIHENIEKLDSNYTEMVKDLK